MNPPAARIKEAGGGDLSHQRIEAESFPPSVIEPIPTPIDRQITHTVTTHFAAASVACSLNEAHPESNPSNAIDRNKAAKMCHLRRSDCKETSPPASAHFLRSGEGSFPLEQPGLRGLILRLRDRTLVPGLLEIHQLLANRGHLRTV